MRDAPDPIRDLVRRMLAAARREGGLTEATASRVEEDFRREYAGDSIYVAKRTPIADADIVKMGARFLNEPADEIAESNGISRRTLYRLLRGR